MNCKNIALLLIFIPLYVSAQNPDISELKVNYNAKKYDSNIILTDSLSLIDDFKKYINPFIIKYVDSSISFGCSLTFVLFKGEISMKFEKELNEFSTSCIKFGFQKLLNYTWKEKRISNKVYFLRALFLFDSEKREIDVEITEYFKDKRPLIFKNTLLL